MWFFNVQFELIKTRTGLNELLEVGENQPPKRNGPQQFAESEIDCTESGIFNLIQVKFCWSYQCAGDVNN